MSENKSTYKILNYEELKKRLDEAYHSGEMESHLPFVDTSAEYSLNELIAMQEKGYSMIFQIGGMYTGLGGAIEYRKALEKFIDEDVDVKNYGEHREEEEAKMWQMTPEQKQAELDKWEKKNMFEGTGQKKIRKNGNNRKRTKGRRKK